VRTSNLTKEDVSLFQATGKQWWISRETWAPILTEEHKLRVFVNWVLRRIFGLKRDEVVGDRRNRIMRSFITHVLRQINLIRMLKSRRMGCRACSTNGNEGECIQGFVGMPEGSIPLGRPIRR
jgi:hypothetical protein